MHPPRTPSTSPRHDLATIPPVTPPTPMTAATLQSVQTPIEHRMVTNTANSSSDRKLNWYQGDWLGVDMPDSIAVMESPWPHEQQDFRPVLAEARLERSAHTEGQ